ncbi:MBL fold metallo-hydrolase [Chromobacterium sp. IIBBL 290-4]|uniref:MBL fold metallo-hydrolase n=1 Tax=Chromobacterium sp. IIBBL 290-4 TaxID=2953890 RepID=UPI0020B725B1|nr:MBL fold metallo-hydrolase [Chromobacterium sp. IIBBL 290-4]UTH74746.1 MBL fold metallo-hydrolase [Chromobacterium sp. IIBBL 290-4]
MKVSVLVENHSHRPELKAEAGLSLWIERGPHRVLFDTGRSGLLLENAAQMGIDLSSLSHLVLSHGHYDHSGGLAPLAEHLRPAARPQLIAHPSALLPRVATLGPWPLRRLGIPAIPETLASQFDLRLQTEPYPFADDFVFLGQIPRERYAEGRGSLGRLNPDQADSAPDMVEDDSALVCKTSKGLIIFSGCAHSGIRHIVDYAKLVCGGAPVRAVIGGFHLRSASPLRVWQVRRYFQRQTEPQLFACHCSGYARHLLPKQMPIATGSRLIFD